MSDNIHTYTLERLFDLVKKADSQIQDLLDPTEETYQFGIFNGAGSWMVGWQIPLNRSGDTDWF